MNRITRIALNGYKSFRFGEDEETRRDNTLEFGSLTVLLGANGAGKSNIISFFGLLRAIMACQPGQERAFDEYVVRCGGSDALLHFGPKETPAMEFEVEHGFDCLRDSQSCGEKFTVRARCTDLPPARLHCEHMAEEFSPKGGSDNGRKDQAKVAYDSWSRVGIYQFDDTSVTGPIRRQRYKEDAGELLGDAGNLAAYLYSLQLNHEKYYQRIVERVRQVCPQFGEFVLKPSVEDTKNVLLNWRERNRPDYLFGPHQISDGTLRFIALTTLFLQPPEMLPSVIVVDEPELGLHPYAITALAGMAKAASQNCQVVLATQSTRLVDEFDMEQIRVIDYDRQKNCSLCRRPDPEALKEWIAEYTTSELWEKNVFGGRP